MKLLGKGKETDDLVVEFKPENIVAAHTVEYGYEGERKALYEKAGQYFLFVGWHCSCNTFDDWEVTVLENEEELKSLLLGWKEKGDAEEKQFAESIKLN